jgi:hypothetical protein
MTFANYPAVERRESLLDHFSRLAMHVGHSPLLSEADTEWTDGVNECVKVSWLTEDGTEEIVFTYSALEQAERQDADFLIEATDGNKVKVTFYQLVPTC